MQATALRICAVGRPVEDFGSLLRLVAEQDQKMCDKDEGGCETLQVGGGGCTLTCCGLCGCG